MPMLVCFATGHLCKILGAVGTDISTNEVGRPSWSVLTCVRQVDLHPGVDVHMPLEGFGVEELQAFRALNLLDRLWAHIIKGIART